MSVTGTESGIDSTVLCLVTIDCTLNSCFNLEYTDRKVYSLVIIKTTTEKVRGKKKDRFN